MTTPSMTESTRCINDEKDSEIQSLKEELECRAGPRELYDKLARNGSYLPPMGFLETIDNSWDAKAQNVFCELCKEKYIQQDDGKSFFIGKDGSNFEIFNKEILTNNEIKIIKSLIKKRLSPLKELEHSSNNVGYNNWGLKGELAYHKSTADIYSWNYYWFVHIHINLQDQLISNKFENGLTIDIYNKEKIPDKIRQKFQGGLIAKEPKWQKNPGTLIYEIFTEHKPNIIESLNSTGYDDIEQNDGLWIRKWITRRYFLKETDKTLIFNGIKIKPFIIQDKISEDKKENRLKENIIEIFKKKNYLYFAIDKTFECKETNKRIPKYIPQGST